MGVRRVYDEPALIAEWRELMEAQVVRQVELILKVGLFSRPAISHQNDLANPSHCLAAT